jgi:hypothetical protein
MGATEADPPPGIATIGAVVDLAFGPTPEDLAAALPGSDVVFAWRPHRALLEGAWGRAEDYAESRPLSRRDGLLFPGLVEPVVLTNARVSTTRSPSTWWGCRSRQRVGAGPAAPRSGCTRDRERMLGSGHECPYQAAIGRPAAAQHAGAAARTARPREAFGAIHGIEALERGRGD